MAGEAIIVASAWHVAMRPHSLDTLVTGLSTGMGPAQSTKVPVVPFSAICVALLPAL